jgi:hypothetical protein
VVTVGDEPHACSWSVACYLLTKAQMQPPIDTDPLPPFGRTSNPMPSPPLHWLGTGTPPFPLRDRGLVLETVLTTWFKMHNMSVMRWAF